jgi:gliding motility-associated-like protein
VKSVYIILLYLTVMLSFPGASAQDISLLEQFNGRYDFTFIGNTLNTIENNSITGQPAPPCIILTGSSATLNLDPEDEIVRAYLYWAGSGTGDFEVKLNGIDIVAERTFSAISPMYLKDNFSAVTDVTEYVKLTGNGIYTLSDLDLSNVIAEYCSHGGNFGGWAMIVVYKNESLPLNQLNLYEGMQRVPTEVTINLNSLNVIDNNGARIGFLAWEGDKNIAEGEELTINDAVLSNSQNPEDNAFNGTNTVTGSNTLYNMDLDIYDISGHINIGATSAVIKLKSGRDFVMVNAIVTKLNSRLPDITVTIDNIQQECDSRFVGLNYTLHNSNSTEVVPPNVISSVFANDTYLQSFNTTASIPIGGSISGQLLLEIPDNLPSDFEVKIIADHNAVGFGTVIEINEDNNTASERVSLWMSPVIAELPALQQCDEGFGTATFNLRDQESQIKHQPEHIVAYYKTEEDALQGIDPIPGPESFTADGSSAQIYYSVSNAVCTAVGSFALLIPKCPPTVYNMVDSHPDGFYDHLIIDGLRDIFLNYRLHIYNRWGKHVWTGKNSEDQWTGTSNTGNNTGGDKLPSGTYYYILELNDPEYPEPLSGFIYLRN